MLIILLMIGFSFGEFLITGRRLLTIVMVMMIIFHGLIEISLCGDEFLFHWRELLVLCNELSTVCIVVVVRFGLRDCINVVLVTIDIVRIIIIFRRQLLSTVWLYIFIPTIILYIRLLLVLFLH